MMIQKIAVFSKPTKIFLQVVVDFVCIIAAYLFSLLLRFGGVIPSNTIMIFMEAILPITAVYIAFFYLFSLYRSMWETASVDEMIKTSLASTISTVVVMAVMSQFQAHLPLSVYIAGGVLVIMFTGYSRLNYRIFRRVARTFSRCEYKRAMIIGAGETGALVTRQLFESTVFKMKPVVIIDDNNHKRGTTIRGVSVAGDRNDIIRLVKKYQVDVIIFCVSSATDAQRQEILKICFETECEVKTVPGMEELLASSKSTMIRDIHMSDLLPRPEVTLDIQGISDYIKDACILVTGGGGSIGSELCRQIAAFSPRELVIFDIYENNAYDLLQHMKRKFPGCNVVVEIGSVRDIKGLEKMFKKHLPDIVFHAAAHKHVPLMETNPEEAVKNNVFGTWNTAQMADKYGVKRFVLISTDKAVKPSNIMGATKRLAEHVISYMNSYSQTKFVAVRFGNVMGSNGSVIPLFKKQISHGGPVTVTHKEITRFFMTIPEAARLVLQAGSIAQDAEIFILDMGKPVRIDDVARTMIRLSGYRPDVDIKVEYTGLRPGEKLHEELFLEAERAEKTKLPGIYVGHAMHPSPEATRENLDWLLLQLNTDADIQKCLMKILHTYQPLVDEGKEREPADPILQPDTADISNPCITVPLTLRELTYSEPL